MVPTDAPTTVPVIAVGGDDGIDFDSGDYDPTSEEGAGDDIVINIPDDPTAAPAAENTPVPTVNSEYAGATPVVIDPVDKPTPTPLPTLTFSYQTYTADKLHLTFEGPVAWVVDDTAGDTYILTNPDAGMDYQAQVVIRATNVANNYSNNDLVREVKGMLDTVKQDGDFKSFSKTNTADRTLLDKKGVYANYSGTYQDGTEVAGRIHVTCIDKVLYSIHISYPKGYTDTYAHGVYRQIRNTIKLSQ